MLVVRKIINQLRLNKVNKGRGRIEIKGDVVLDICKDAEIIVNGKLIIGASDWKSDNRVSGLKISSGGCLIVNNTEKIYSGSYVSVGKDAVLEFGGNGFINHGCQIDCNKSIKIGKGTIVAKQTIIRDSDNHNMLYPGYRKTDPIEICENVWIGMRACILKGITIEKGSIVAAGAVVTKNVPPNSLVAGIPAKIIKTEIEWK